jgi:FkbM family methyltransferase
MRSIFFRAFSATIVRLFGSRTAALIWRVPGAHAFYRWLMPRLRPSEVVVDGHTIRLDRMDSLLLSVNGNYEEAEQRLFSACLRPGDVVLDIGGHIGLYTLQAARGVGPHGRVYAFEPSSENFTLLEQNIAINGYANVEAVRAAVTDVEGEVQLTLSNDNTGDHSLSAERTSHRPSETVQGIRLDEWLPADMTVDVVKMDIQGAEPLAIAGATAVLERSPNVVLFTEHSPLHLGDHGTAAQHVEQLQGLGFVLHEVTDAGLVPVDSTEMLARPAVSEHAYWDLLGVKGDAAAERVRAATGGA